MKGMLVSLNPSLEEQTDRVVRQLYDVYANLTKLENELNAAGFMKKRKIQTQYDKVNGDLEDDFMRIVRDFSDLYRKEQKSITNILPRLQEIKPAETKGIAEIGFPSIGAGDMDDFEKLHGFADAFSKKCIAVHNDISRDTKALLDENKRTLETYERHITIDRGDVATTVSNEDVVGHSLSNTILLMDKLRADQTYLEGKRDEVGRMLGVSLMGDIESLQGSSETSSRLGLELPMDFSKKLRTLARDASKANNLTTLLSLESQLHSQRLQLASTLKDRIINMQHEVTTKIVGGGIPTTSDIIPTPPTVSVENEAIPGLMSSYQQMVEWAGQVKIALKDKVEEMVDDVDKATDTPDDTGIKDIKAVKNFVSESRKELKKNEIDSMVQIYLKAKTMDEDHRRFVTDVIRNYLTRFNELATSADRVLDYAQLSKKAPKVEDLDGSVTYLLQSLESLRTAVESGVATFRDACEQEIDAIVQDLQTIKPAYAEIFVPIISDLDEGAGRIQKLEDFSEIRSEMRTIKDTILVKAKDALENLRYRLGVKIRLAAAKLMGAGVEIPNVVQEAISELNNVGVAAETVFSLPAIARKMIEIYEKKITNKVIESLSKEVDTLSASFERAGSIGVALKKEIKILTKLQEKPPTELEDAADAFDQLMALTTSDKIRNKVKDRADDAYRQVVEALKIFEEQGKEELVVRLRLLLEKVPEQLEASSKHIFETLDVCLTLANIHDEMLGVIKSMATKDSEKYDAELREKSSYFSTIERVYEKYPKDFDKIVYPVKKMKTIETQLESSEDLDTAMKYFGELKELRVGWVEKAEKMDDWHKSLKMYMTGFSPSGSIDERNKFIDDAIRKIRETYSRDDISSYLTWALKEIAQSMVEKRG
jgi:hypothetical protein